MYNMLGVSDDSGQVQQAGASDVGGLVQQAEGF